MKTLTTTEANGILDEMLRIQRDLSGNDQRSEYKIQFRKVINLCLETEDRAKIKDKCGFTINRMTDMGYGPCLPTSCCMHWVRRYAQARGTRSPLRSIVWSVHGTTMPSAALRYVGAA